MSTPCIPTTYAIDRDGYGLVTVEGTKKKHHRLVYCATHNISHDSIQGKIVMHTCDNASCVNPDHLVLGTHADNTADMWKKGRQNVPSFVGTKNPSAKLTEDDVRSIRELGRRYSYGQLSDQFRVSKSTIQAILTRRTWAHVTDNKPT